MELSEKTIDTLRIWRGATPTGSAINTALKEVLTTVENPDAERRDRAFHPAVGNVRFDAPVPEGGLVRVKTGRRTIAVMRAESTDCGTWVLKETDETGPIVAEHEEIAK